MNKVDSYIFICGGARRAIRNEKVKMDNIYWLFS